LQDKQFDTLYEAFAARPPDEPVITALRHATVTTIHACEAGTGGFDAEKFSCVQQMIRDNPAVFARSLEACTPRLDELGRRIAARMGVDPVTDPRPVFVAAVATTAVQTAMAAWRGAEPDAPASELADRALALLEQGINYPSAIPA
jgi:MftR C-terminal domain